MSVRSSDPNVDLSSQGHAQRHEHEHGHGHGHEAAGDDCAEREHVAMHQHGPLAPAGADQHGKFTAREAKQARRLGMVLVLVSVFFVFEYIGATLAESVVLRADALHLLMDVVALAMSLMAMRLAIRRPTARFTFGLRRIEPVAAIINAILVLTATIEIVHEAIEHLGEKSSPKAPIMLMVASAALVVNGLSAWLLHGAIHHGHDHDHGHGHDHGDDHDHSGHGHAHSHEGPKHEKKHGHVLNLRGAWLHLLGDVLGSVAALVAALVIRFGGPASVDPIASFLVAAILVLGAVRLIREAALVLLEAAPVHLPVATIRQIISSFPGVLSVHRLHVWTLGAGHDALMVHVRVSDHDSKIAARLSAKLRDQFGIEYVSVQIEP